VISVYAGLSFLKGAWMVTLLIFIFGACWGSRAVTEWAFLASIVPRELKNIVVAFMEGFWDLGSSAGSFLAGVLAGFLPYPTIFLLMAFVNMPTLPTILVLREEKNSSKN
jgi:MFS family permease